MKKATILKSIQYIFLFLTFNSAISQENFSLRDNTVQWQKVFDNSLDISQAKKQLLKNSTVTSIDEIDQTLIVTVNDMLIDYEGAGRTNGNTSIYLQGSRFSFMATIDFKENKYRVTINQIKGTFNFTAGFITEGEVMTLETAALKKKNTEFKNSFLKNDAAIFCYNFEKMFTFNNASPTDW